MKKLTTIFITGLFISLLFASFATAELADIKVGKGTLKVGGILQAGYTYHLEDDEGVDGFTLNRARTLFWGCIVPDKIKYFLQFEHKDGTGILDYKARFFYIRKTEITVGRFLPNFTLYMPSSTAKLEMINYPLTTQKYAMWRQVGVQTTTKTEYIDFNLGIFNGADQKNNTSDNNDAKDFMIRADIHPPMEQAKVNFGGFAWIGKALPVWVDEFDTPHVLMDETLKKNRFGGFAKVDYENDDLKVRFRGEFVMGKDEMLIDEDINNAEEIESQAFFMHLGIQPMPKVEFLFRYDSYDGNTDTDDDGISWITGGVNYYLEGMNSMFYLNYIHKAEEGDDVDNDLLLAQVQILF